MKKLLSVLLSTTIAIFIFSFSLTANAISLDAVLMGTDQIDNADRTWWLANTQTLLNNMGYQTGINAHTSKEAALFKLKDQNTKIWVINAHGGAVSVDFSEEEKSITNDEILSLPDQALSNKKLVIFATCNSGQGIDTFPNMVNVTYNKGAKTVIGFKSKINVNQTNRWLYEFFVGCNDGKNIQDACTHADYWTKFYHFGQSGNLDNRSIKGSTSAKIKLN